jgi:hypothetical protein
MAAAGRVEEEHYTGRRLSFRLSGPAETAAVLRGRLPGTPTRVLAGGTEIASEWDAPTGTVVLRHGNDPRGVAYEIQWS